MPLYIISVPANRPELRTEFNINGFIIDAVDVPSARAACLALIPGQVSPGPLAALIAQWTVVTAAATAQGGFANAAIQGRVIGPAYSGPRSGA